MGLLEDNIVYGMGRTKASAEGHCAEDGRLHEYQSNYSYVAEEDEKISHSNGKPSVRSSQEDEDDGSDFEIQDVKVCDICGDAGREDMLAICSRCSDGAEHTYCMRDMLDKVPDGNWLCEECKFNEETEKQKRGPSEVLVDNGKNKFLGRSSFGNSDPSEFDNTDTHTDQSKINNLILHKELENKRIGDNIEVTATAKKLSVESNVASGTYSPGRTVLSRDNSFKSSDKVKTKQPPQLSSGYSSANDSSETVRSPVSNSVQAVHKGVLQKANSFSTFNPKPKIKLVDEIPQKKKQTIDAKDGHGKMMGKSLSFKGNLSHINMSEAKVKMLSPKFSHIQEVKGLKQLKERGFERKNSISSRDPTSAQSEGKLSTSARASGQLTHRTSDPSSCLGEVKRQSTAGPINGGSAPIEGSNDFYDLKQNQVSSKDEATPSSSKAGELTDQCAMSGTSRGSAVDTSVVRSTKEGINKDNKLKAAIEVAIRKKMDINKRVAEKFDDSSVLKVDSVSKAPSGDSLPISSQPRGIASTQGMHQGASTFRSFGSQNVGVVSNGKHLKVFPNSLSLFEGRDLSLGFPSNGELLLRMSAIPEQECVWQGDFEVDRGRRVSNLYNGVQAHISICASRKVAALVKKFPEKVVLTEVPCSCTWLAQFKDQGVKEDNIALYFFAKDLASYERDYKNLLEYTIKNDLALRGNIDGIELLVFPSNHLPKKSQRWNMLFFLWGVFRGRRPNCLGHKSACAEKLDASSSDIVHQDKDGINSIPEISCLQGPRKENLSASAYHHHAFPGNEAPPSVEPPVQPSPRFSNGECDVNRNLLDHAGMLTETNTDCSDRKSNCRGLGYPELPPQAKCSNSLSERGYPGCKMAKELHRLDKANDSGDASDEAWGASENRSSTRNDKESVPSHYSHTPLVSMDAVGSFNGLGEADQDLTQCNGDMLKPGSKMKCEEGRLDALNGNGDDMRSEKLLQEPGCSGILNNLDVKTKAEGVWVKEAAYSDMRPGKSFSLIEDLASKVIMDNQHSVVKKRLRGDNSEAGTCPNATTISQEISPNNVEIGVSGDVDQEGVNKRVRRTADFYGCNHPRDTSRFSAAGTSSSSLDDKFSERNDEKSASINLRSAERYFFLAESNQAVDDSSFSLESSDLLRPDGSPNLELGLGSEKKQPKQEILSSFARNVVEEMYQDKPPDPDIVKLGRGEEESSETLSLSLAFPLSD